MILDILKLIQYAVLVILLILVELGLAAFIFFDKSWREVRVTITWISKSLVLFIFILAVIISFLPANSN